MMDKICGRWILLFQKHQDTTFWYQCLTLEHTYVSMPTCAEPDSEDMNINYFGAYDKMILVPLL